VAASQKKAPGYDDVQKRLFYGGKKEQGRRWRRSTPVRKESRKIEQQADAVGL